MRLADAGAIVAATVGRGARTRTVLVRLRHDGTVVEDFGGVGAGSASAGRGAAAAVAADGAGRRIVVAVRGGRRLRLVGLDGAGRTRAGFGDRGSVALTPGSGPVALAVRGAQLVAGAGRALTALDARTGRILAHGAATPGAGDPAACAAAGVAALLLDGRGRVLVAGDTYGAAGCRAALAVHDARTLAPAGPPVAMDATRALLLGLPGERDACVAAAGAGAVRARRVDPATIGAADPLAGAPPIAMAARERLSGLAPVPGDGCDLLLARAGGGGRVVATGGAGEPMLLTALPARFRAGAASVCRRHLLVAGARPRHGRPAGALAVVPLGTHG